MTSPAAPAGDEDLARRAAAGDETAFEDLVERYQSRAYRLACRLLGSEADAPDVLQEAFLSAYRHLASFRGEARFSTWLFRIVTNAALMKLRTRGRRPEDSIEDLLPTFVEDGHHTEQFGEWALPADTNLLRRETRAQVRAAIDALPDGYRTVLLLRDIEEMSTEESARTLGLNPNTVKIRLHRARQALLKLLTPGMKASRLR